VTRAPEPTPVQVLRPETQPEIQPENEPESTQATAPAPEEPVEVDSSEVGGGNSAVVIEVPPVVEPPRVMEATRLLQSGQLRALRRVKVQNRQWTSSIYRMSSEDQDATFYLNREWEWFEVRIAVADNATTSTAGLWGWIDGQPSRRAFHYPRVEKGQASIVLRVRVADATYLTLAPTYPGNPVILIHPRFIRRTR
jgi:hypothetical protein